MFDDTEEMTSKTLGERLNRSLTLLSVYQPFLRSELWKTWATALAATATDRRFPGPASSQERCGLYEASEQTKTDEGQSHFAGCDLKTYFTKSDLMDCHSRIVSNH